MKKLHLFSNLKHDLPASVVVFFVAIPLCLGIALASGAPLFSGLIAGIIGGIVVGLISGSEVGVSGPAAGLAAIVLTAISSLGSFEIFLLALVLGGILQLALGLFKAGVIGYYFPSSVIRGMLTGIGLIIIIKQIPYFFGYDSTSAQQTDSSGFEFLSHINIGSTVIAITGLGILLLWEKVLTKKAKIFQLVQGPLVAVVVGIFYTYFSSGNQSIGIPTNNLVNIPKSSDFTSLLSNFTFPDFSAIDNKEVWIVAVTIALVASLETLLCLEATDKLDQQKRETPKNRELIAQGIGNMLSGFIGGLPVTQVIVRSSANIQSGGKTKMSAIIHGFLLLISIMAIPNLLNMIPLSVLAAILFVVGYKLAKPELFISIFKLGWKQFLPFITTVVGIIATDLLTGIFMGLVVGIYFILVDSYKNSHALIVKNDKGSKNSYRISFAEEVTFINKGPILKELERLPDQANLELDVRKTKFLDFDILETINDFLHKNAHQKIQIKVITERGAFENPSDLFRTIFPHQKTG
ncbi:MAG: SulP family inorganic anion transporter [Flavobacteriaceae bacterium]|jgi:MFS superfamily sulfate permease-like transporter